MNSLSTFMCLCHEVLYNFHIFLCQAIGLVVIWNVSQVMNIKPITHVPELFASITWTTVTNCSFR